MCTVIGTCMSIWPDYYCYVCEFEQMYKCSELLHVILVAILLTA